MYNEEIKTATIPIAMPIPIKKEQYNVINMRFDPVQNSPPSLWKMRLNHRLGESPIKRTQKI